MNLRPSALPILAKCTEFESGSTEFAELGSDRHAALHAHFQGDDSLLDLLDEESQAGIRWAAEYIRLHAPTGDYPLVWETKLRFTAPNFADIEGTPDVVCGNHIFDFKWRPRDYTAQMACYALMVLDARNDAENVRVHLCYGATKRAEVLEFDREAAEGIIAPILDRCDSTERVPTPCEYCGWCAKRLTCPAMLKPAQTIALGYGDMAEISNWHPSEMDKAEHLAMALSIWRNVLKKWGESVEYHAMEAATKKGLKLPGFELKERQGKKFVSDTQRAFELSKLPPQKFLLACGVRLNTSKSTGLIGLDKVFAETEGTVAAGKRAAEKRLAEVITRGKSTLQLVSSKDGEAETD